MFVENVAASAHADSTSFTLTWPRSGTKRGGYACASDASHRLDQLILLATGGGSSYSRCPPSVPARVTDPSTHHGCSTSPNPQGTRHLPPNRLPSDSRTSGHESAPTSAQPCPGSCCLDPALPDARGPGHHGTGGSGLRITVAHPATTLGAPSPTRPGQGGQPVLAPPFVAWLMGLPDRWVAHPRHSPYLAPSRYGFSATVSSPPKQPPPFALLLCRHH